MARTARKKTPRKPATSKPATRKPATRKAAPRAKTTATGGYRAKIRMYRQGLGDCFLITLPRAGSARPYYVMIDCGVILGTADPATKMAAVVDNIATVTTEIDLLIATHEHWDHLSGFVQAKDSFGKLKINEVWLGWTENPKDPLTQKLKKEKGLALAALRLGLAHLQLAGDHDNGQQLSGVLDFFGAAKGASTSDALDNVRKMSPKLRYCLPTDDPVDVAGTGARFYVLGPPHDEKQLRKINPSKSKPETYGIALANLSMFLDGAATAFDPDDPGRAFDQQYEIPFSFAGQMDFFRQHYWQPQGAAPDAWRRIDTDWLAGSTELALQLDSLTNNTSLVLAIELADGDVLLFAADAQVGNWLSWQERSWPVGGKTVTGPDLLKRTIFYKVGHHGSHNATLREKGLEQMERLRVAMIPVDEVMAGKKGWNHMPLKELVTALGKQAKGAVLRVDKKAPDTSEHVVEDKLFFEVTF